MNSTTIDRLADRGKEGILILEDSLAAAYGYARADDDLEAMAKIETAMESVAATHKVVAGILPPKTRAGGGK